MEKILFVTDAISLKTKALDFAAFLCNLSHSRLTGIFLENIEREERPVEVIAQAAAMCGTSCPVENDINVIKENCCKDNIEQFRKPVHEEGSTVRFIATADFLYRKSLLKAGMQTCCL